MSSVRSVFFNLSLLCAIATLAIWVNSVFAVYDCELANNPICKVMIFGVESSDVAIAGVLIACFLAIVWSALPKPAPIAKQHEE